MSGVATSCRVAWSCPRTFHDACPHSVLAACSVVTSVMPGRNTFTEDVSSTTWRPCSPHRSASWASPCTTATTWMPLPPESDSQDGSGTGQIWVTSSSPIKSGGSSRPDGDAWPICAAIQWISDAMAANSGATGASSETASATMYTVPAWARKAGMPNPVPGAGRTQAARSGSAMKARALLMTIRIGAADRGGRVLAAVDRGPAERRGDAADVLGVEHVHRAELRADRAGQRVHIRFGAGGDDRPGVAQDDVAQERRLERPWWCHHEQVLFQRDPQAVPVVRPAEEHRVLARVQEPVAERQRAADARGAAQDRETGPAQVQAEGVCEALSWVQPKVQPDPQVAGAVAGQVPGGQERPRREGRHDEHDGQGDGELDDHRGAPFRAFRTALRRAARAVPGCRPARGAGSALIAATASSGIEAKDPGRSVARARNRAVLVTVRGGGAGADRDSGARRPGATGHSASTQARNPARVEAGAWPGRRRPGAGSRWPGSASPARPRSRS